MLPLALPSNLSEKAFEYQPRPWYKRVGRKRKNMSLRLVLFHWFIHVRTSLKGRLPVRLFVGKAKDIWKQHTGSLDDFSCSWKWIKRWCKVFNVSIKKPNKHYKVSHEGQFPPIGQQCTDCSPIAGQLHPQSDQQNNGQLAMVQIVLGAMSTYRSLLPVQSVPMLIYGGPFASANWAHARI